VSRYLREELVNAVADHKALLIVGTGVSVSATRGVETASWVGLIQSGVDRVRDLRPDLPDRWANDIKRMLRSRDVDDLIVAAERVTTELRRMPGQHFEKWLEDAIGQLSVKDPSLLQSIADLRAPICTTNYDTLIDQHLGLVPVTWQDGSQMQEALRETGTSLVHLHGVWSEPDSVVFGYRSYSDLLNHAAAQALIRALGAFHSLVFIGMGDGLSDPNFSRLMSWFKETLPADRNPPLILLREDAVKRSYKEIVQVGVLPVSYGPRYEDLAIYLADLAAEAGTTLGITCRHFTWDEMCGYLSRLFGRIYRDFKPDIVLAMSGAGNFAPAYCLQHDPSDTPLLCAVTFPRRDPAAAAFTSFADSADRADWMHFTTSRWDVFLPNVLNYVPAGGRVLIFDDRVVTGDTQREVAEVLMSRNFVVKRAAVVVHPQVQKEVDFYEVVLDGEYYFPWGGKYGRSSSLDPTC